MIIELRKKSQITIPKEIINSLQLKEGDYLDISTREGAILVEPVSIYSKAYVKKLEKTIMKISEEPDKYTEGPFSSIEDAIEYLESNDDKEKKKKDKKD